MENTTKNKAVRKPKSNPRIHSHYFKLTESENAKLLTLFKSSGLTSKSKFLISMLLDREVKTIRVDVAALQYHATLTKVIREFRAIGINYNQIVKIYNKHFTYERAKHYISRLEENTKNLSKLCYYIIKLTKEFEDKHLNSNP
ncbi:hypothetical protein [Myroides sp. N17-2]|uniref:plasmid mobilization protein n=1 Tax=Myroides sp. N17-2 TaxID=2030799 RepID=UPI000EFAC539|nr:hypothetical protein [Myroides sp. N17-2]